MPVNVMKVAKQHYKEKLAGPLGTVTVPEWIDEGQPISLTIMPVGASEQADIADARKRAGEFGLAVMTIIKSCFVGEGDQRKRAFTDTDERELMSAVDPAILMRVYGEIVQIQKGQR